MHSTLLVLALVSPVLAGDVLTVGNHAGADHAQIQDAVTAASDGDVVLVWTGTYDSFLVTGKGVKVVERPGNEVRVAGSVTVLATDHHHEVTLIGLRVEADHFTSFGQEEALLAYGARGGLRIERCQLYGADGWAYSGSDHGGDAARLENCLDVSFTGCHIEAGDGDWSFGGFQWNRGGDGVESKSSNVALHTSTVLGGDGGEHDVPGDGLEGYAGHGIVLTGTSTGALHDVIAVGGDGGSGGLACPPGGHGVFVRDLAHAQLLDCTLQGGESGCHPAGTPGDPLHVESGATANLLPGAARTHDAPTPVLGGAPFQVEFHGQPGDAAFLLLSYGTDFMLTPQFNGALLVETPLAMERRFMGVVPAGGTLTKTLTAPPVPPGSETYSFVTQAMFQDPGGVVWLATPSVLVVLQ